MSEEKMKMPEIDCTLNVKVHSYGAVCLPSQEGSTGYHRVLPAVPNCINRTADGWIPAIHGPVHPGIPGLHYFVFRGETPTHNPSPKMEFLLFPPGAGKGPVQKAVCTVVVTK